MLHLNAVVVLIGILPGERQRILLTAQDDAMKLVTWKLKCVSSAFKYASHVSFATSSPLQAKFQLMPVLDETLPTSASLKALCMSQVDFKDRYSTTSVSTSSTNGPTIGPSTRKARILTDDVKSLFEDASRVSGQLWVAIPHSISDSM
ncbi:hypothetical protein AcV5_008919 [Taiwanofungus camphoratus]|nr:hypothetical protein AcV5_008919 [Antrodia cinnamomea]